MLFLETNTYFFFTFFFLEYNSFYEYRHMFKINDLIIACQVKGFLSGCFISKGGGNLFSQISNYLTLKLHNVFVFIQIKNRDIWWSIRPKSFIRPNFGVPGHTIGQKFLSAQKSTFSPHLVTCPPLFFLIMNLRKNNCFYCLRYEHLYLENIPLKMMLLCYLAQNEKESTTDISQKWDFYEKKFCSLFTAVFFDFFPKIVKK